MTLRLAAALLALAALTPRSAAADCADVGLVLAIDASGSIDAVEFELQRQGYFAALTAQPVTLAFADAGTVEVAAVFWGDSSYKPQVVSWHRITSADDLTAFAKAMLELPREISGDTHIGTGIGAALAMFDLPGHCSYRRVIDLSGDGRASVEPRRASVISLPAARARAEHQGVTINALAITSEDEGLPDYYRDNLILGPDAFVLHVEGLETFGQAMTQKLMRELMSALPAPRPDRGRG
ncbi:DUF1194 domain-containing protein [Paragemmobacter straminiformis]|uniref:DUF1194 domain-containing protein n=1 Tax=Paragemmobacter straminiformis TaxID=2045119 RepID=A0A842I8Y5_9RHOB|nr:DUF1194 domain-containing protein [Gemmobacter straminiformis]MBC2836512.1 DUF1194 domain-containing protein [Gemmobacter straminiformis]